MINTLGSDARTVFDGKGTYWETADAAGYSIEWNFRRGFGSDSAPSWWSDFRPEAADDDEPLWDEDAEPGPYDEYEGCGADWPTPRVPDRAKRRQRRDWQAPRRGLNDADWRPTAIEDCFGSRQGLYWYLRAMSN